jgi:hypothetical protein
MELFEAEAVVVLVIKTLLVVKVSVQQAVRVVVALVVDWVQALLAPSTKALAEEPTLRPIQVLERAVLVSLLFVMQAHNAVLAEQ